MRCSVVEMRITPWVVLISISAVSSPVGAAESCRILYRVNATLEVTDTPLGKGDQIVDNVEGQLVLEYKIDGGAIADGKVKVLHFSMYERFVLDTIADVTTTLHHYSPRCNGADDPPWRLPADPGFPKDCRYEGNSSAVAIGKLDRDAGKIVMAKCRAAPSYWAEDDDAYKPSDKSRGRGCLSDMHVAGNIHCDGRLACKMGGLERGDNPQFDVWNQPLIHGPPGSEASVRVSSDLSTITTPRRRKDGYQSYNLPNNSPSRTWFSLTARRDDQSPHTTCP